MELTLLNYFKNAHSHCDTIESKCNVIKEDITKINILKKEVASFQRKCKKGKLNEDICQRCTQKKKELSDLFEFINAEYSTIDALPSYKFNYWADNFDSIHKGICDNMNLRKILFLTNCKDKNLLVLINSVDQQSQILSQILLSAKGAESTSKCNISE